MGLDRQNRGRSVWAYLLFLVLFALLLLLVSYAYLLPALEAYSGADNRGKKLLGAQAMLLLSVLLVMLGLFGILIFRIGRFFLPGSRGPRQKTQYTDAWTEAGKRMQAPPKAPPKDPL